MSLFLLGIQQALLRKQLNSMNVSTTKRDYNKIKLSASFSFPLLLLVSPSLPSLLRSSVCIEKEILLLGEKKNSAGNEDFLLYSFLEKSQTICRGW